MAPVFVGLLLAMVGAMGLIFAMRWLAAIITWCLIGIFHGLLLAGKNDGGVFQFIA